MAVERTGYKKQFSFVFLFVGAILISALVTRPHIFTSQRTIHQEVNGVPGRRRYLPATTAGYVTDRSGLRSTIAWNDSGVPPYSNLQTETSVSPITSSDGTRITTGLHTTLTSKYLTTTDTSFRRTPSSNGTRKTTRNQTMVSEVLGFPEELRRLRPKILAELPVKFLPDYKNPCYLDKAGAFTCLPYFFLLGLPKCGTTDLWSKIHRHPHITSRGKEPHWWTRSSRGGQNMSVYAEKRMTPGITGEHRHDDVVGDGSASTFWDNSNWLSIYPEYANEGPPYIIADVIRAVLPNAKLVVIYRDPTDRLYSDYVFFHNKNTISPEDFHSRVVTTLGDFNNCTASGRSERTCAYLPYNSGTRLHIGLYPIYTRDWLERFPRDQFMFIELGDWHGSCEKILPELFEFLEVKTLPTGNITAICAQREKNVNQSKKSAVGKMLNQTRALLRDYYRPYVVQLARLLGDERFLWGYADA